MIWFRYWPIVAVLVGMYVLENAWAAMLLYHGGLVWGILIKREELATRQWKSPIVIVIGLMIAGLIAVPAVRWGLPLLTSSEVGGLLEEKLTTLGLDGPSFWLFAVYFCSIHPVLEEVGWRGALHVSSRSIHGNDIEFAAYHLFVLYWIFPGNWLLLGAALITLTLSAWFWRQLRDARGLWVVIGFHAAADLGILLGAARLAGIPAPF